MTDLTALALFLACFASTIALAYGCARLNPNDANSSAPAKPGDRSKEARP